MIDEARTKSAKIHFVSLMDTCHLRNSELEAHVTLWKDDSGSHREGSMKPSFAGLRGGGEGSKDRRVGFADPSTERRGGFANPQAPS